jgi:hypothetical protein
VTRPQSIVTFERLFLTAQVVWASQLLVAWDEGWGLIAGGFTTAGINSLWALPLIALSFAIPLLLCYGVARRGSENAKWFLIFLFFYALLGTVLNFVSSSIGVVAQMIALAATALEAIALAQLFRPGATGWLRGERPVDPGAFN